MQAAAQERFLRNFSLLDEKSLKLITDLKLQKQLNTSQLNQKQNNVLLGDNKTSWLESSLAVMINHIVDPF